MPYEVQQKKKEVLAIIDRIAKSVYTPVADLDMMAWVTSEPVSFAERESGTALALTVGQSWGKLFDCAWFHFTGQIPASAASSQIVLLIDLNGEACVVDAEGNPRQGLTTKNSDFDMSFGKPGKRVVPVTDCAVGGECIDVWADAGCNDLFGNFKAEGTVREACIAIKHPELYALSYDMEVLHELMLQLPQDSARAHRLWAAIYAASCVLDQYTDDEACQARAILAPELAKRGGDPSLTIGAVGHAHIDLAWLWPIRETIRKGARTFSTALQMMERYPDYIFGASQPQLYKWMKEYYPGLYAGIQQRIAEGRWDVQGAMWVEADTNITGGESLVRQLLYGKRFFRREFGKDVRNLWLPDVFGYCGSLPQLLKKAGVDYFLTQKLSWCEINRYPHHTFHWQGIDGTKILAHLPPEDTYNSSAAPRAVVKTERSFLDKSTSDRCYMLFGIGDGGGGPGEEHLERLAREKNLQGLCPVVQERAEQFFAEIERDAEKYCTWSGELYLEKHQGTFTTQARNKRYNRLMEFSLREAEWLATTSHWVNDTAYPAQQLLEIWEEVMLYQFHDILPGSSITRVYEESCARYAELLNASRQLADNAMATVTRQIDTTSFTHPVIISNALSWDRDEFIEVDGTWQQVHVPSLGYTTVEAGESVSFVAPTATTTRLENDYLRVTFAADGAITAITDKTNGRQVLAPDSMGNKLAVYRDSGDAWDFPMNYAERVPEYFQLQSAEARVDGPRAILRQHYIYGTSTLTQDIILTLGSRCLEFVTEVDWQESERMLRTSFPVAVFATEATYEIQYGSLRRPTHQNTSWDMARFEVCAQKWVDLSEHTYGVALLNDCKYGYRVQGNALEMNLLRSPHYPDPQADLGHHRFTYALLPHAGNHIDGRVIQEAYALNVPLRQTADTPHAGTLSAAHAFVQVDTPNVVVEAVKMAEDTDDMIIRLYETIGSSTCASIKFGIPVGGVTLVNLLEEDIQALTMQENCVELPFTPFEVHTLRVTRAQS